MSATESLVNHSDFRAVRGNLEAVGFRVVPLVNGMVEANVYVRGELKACYILRTLGDAIRLYSADDAAYCAAPGWAEVISGQVVGTDEHRGLVAMILCDRFADDVPCAVVAEARSSFARNLERATWRP